MTRILIIASELAIITGHNKYETKEKVINSILNRSKIKKIYIPKSKIEEKLLQLKDEELNGIKKELNLGLDASLYDIESKIKRDILINSYDKSIDENDSKEKVNEVIKNMPIITKCLENNIKQDLRMRRGNLKEDNNLDKIEDKRNIVINNRNTQMYEKVLYNIEDHQVVIRGKIDGMNEEYIVETKNRTKRLFNMIPEYEKVQLNAYMFLTDKTKSLHIEHFNDNSNEKEYEFDKLFWEDCIDKIMVFIKNNIENHLS